ncbi:hypothetical protein [Bartonella jaculi]|uniref:Uncharacterized protein n=1 Tax=Bartonella jaculi TaxID=686226 RepID=A0ABP9N337_9HYPH
MKGEKVHKNVIITQDEKRQHSPEREAQQRKEEGKKMAFAL